MSDRVVRIILMSLLVLFAGSYSIYTAIRFLYTPYKTETLLEYSVTDSYRAKAVAIRDETVLEYNGDGFLVFTKVDGAVVIAQSVIANVYQTTDDLHWQTLLAQYDAEIELLKTAQNASGQLIGNDVLLNQINDSVSSLVSASVTRDLRTLSENRNQLQLLLSRRLIASGRQKDFSERINYLTSQKEYARSQVSEHIGTVTAKYSGYFCSVNDGYENLLTIDGMMEYSIEEYLKFINGEVLPKPTGGIGRVHDGHNWYLAVEVSKDHLDRFSASKMVMLDFGIATCREVPASIHQVFSQEGNDTAIVILKCNRLNEALIKMRFTTLDIRFGSFSGLRINPLAIRYNGQTEGVYVLSGGMITFKAIERIYSSDEFVLCKYDEFGDAKALKLFDDVIIEGADLYDGKII